MWKSDDDEEFTLGFDLSKSPLNLSKYNIPSISSDTKIKNDDLDSKSIDGRYDSCNTKTNKSRLGRYKCFKVSTAILLQWRVSL